MAMASTSNKHAVVVLFIMVVAALLLVAPAAACGGHPCPKPAGKCPVNTVKLGACVDVLDGLIHAVVPPETKKNKACCPLISGLADLDAAVCVCLAINANVLGVIDLDDVTVDLTLLLNHCGRTVPAGFQCA